MTNAQAWSVAIGMATVFCIIVWASWPIDTGDD